MDEKLVANYLTKLKTKTGLTYEAVAEKSDIPESTVKNLFIGKSEKPRLDTVAPVVYAMGGSLDEMFNPDKNKDAIKEVSVVSLKEAYEFQLATMKETNEMHIANIRAHYEQHHQDLVDNFEKRLADKRELNEALRDQIAKQETAYTRRIKELTKGTVIRNWIITAFVIGVIVLLALEFIHPAHGWIRW